MNKTVIRTVLFVDDDPLVTKLFQKACFEHNYLCIAVNSVEKAILQLDLQMPDLILSDYRMEGLDGLDFRKILSGSAAFGRIPFMFLTSCKDADFMNEAALINAKVLQKDLNIKHIFSEIGLATHPDLCY